jgi:hypothetical protein
MAKRSELFRDVVKRAAVCGGALEVYRPCVQSGRGVGGKQDMCAAQKP